MILCIDSCVYIAAANDKDLFHQQSQVFMNLLFEETIITPSIVVAETITILTELGYTQPKRLLKEFAKQHLINLDMPFIKQYASSIIPSYKLKTSDLVIAITCKIQQARLITWDKQLLKQSITQAITPKQYLKTYA